jgi:hypothetical protein
LGGLQLRFAEKGIASHLFGPWNRRGGAVNNACASCMFFEAPEPKKKQEFERDPYLRGIVERNMEVAVP